MLEVVTDANLPEIVRIAGSIQEPDDVVSKAEKHEKKKKKKDKNFR